MTMIGTSDSRFPKAVAIADQAGQWLKCRSSDGRKACGVPSQALLVVVFALAEARQAQIVSRTGHGRGRIVLHVADPV